VPVTDISHIKINSTKTIKAGKSMLPITLLSIFGGLAVIVLLISVLTYILVKRGYIRIFNQPRTRTRDTERTTIVDSSSTTGGSSPSKK
jgi:hypothetical protein